MWSAVNWLSQKAGINLDDANEVLNCSDSLSSSNQASTDIEEQSREAGKENQAGASNGTYNTQAGSKRSRRSSRWVSGTNTAGSANNSSSSSYNGSASPPITPIMVPSGGGTFRTSSANGQLTHPAMPPIMVPTGSRNNSTGFSTLTGLSPSVSPMGMHSKNNSPTSLTAWKDVSMAADVNSPGFAFRIVRQAEKHAQLGSRNYPTVQEKYLHAKHLPNIKLRGSPKPILTPLKPRSVPLLPLAPPSPPSSEGSPLAPILPGSTSPSTATLFPSPHSSSSMPDFRNTDYYASPAMRNSDSGGSSVGRPLPPVLINASSANGISSVVSTSSVGLAATMPSADFASLATTNSSVSVTARLGRASSNPSSSGEGFSSTSGTEDLGLLGDECQQQEDPTSLQAVLAALGKSQSGKGVKRGRLAEYEDPGNKRQCSDSLPQTLNCITQPSVGDHSSTSNGTTAGVTSSSSSNGGGGEKRALDTSSGSSTSLNSSGHCSPCAKLPRTLPNDPLLPQSTLYEGAASKSSSVLHHGSSGYSSTAAAMTHASSWRVSYSLAKQRLAVASGAGTTTTTTDSSKNTKVSSSPFPAKSARLFSSLNQSIGLGGCSRESTDTLLDEECPKKKKRCVNPWFASMSSSRKMLTQEQISPIMESELDAQNDSDDSDKSSDDSDHLSEQSMVVNGCGDKGPTDDGGGEQDNAVNNNRNDSPSAHAVATTSADSSPRGATPRLVSLAAHRSDKKATNTRLKKMMGLLFNLTDEEIELSETSSLAVTLSSTAPATATNTNSASIAQSQAASVSAVFKYPAASNGASTTSESNPSFSFTLKPATVSTTQCSDVPLALGGGHDVTSSATFSLKAATVSTTPSSDVPLALGGGNDVTASATFKLPTVAPKTDFAGVLASAVASIGSAEGQTKAQEATTTAGNGESTEPSDMSRAATLPVSSSCTGGSSVSASFTVALPNKAITVPTSDVPTSGGPMPALPSYSDTKKAIQVIDGPNPLLALLSSGMNSSNKPTTPSFNFGTPPASGFTNPVLANSTSQNIDGKTQCTNGGFSTSSDTAAIATAPSVAAPFVGTSLGVSQQTPSGASNLFSFGSSAANAAKQKTSPISATPAASGVAPSPQSLFSFGPGSISTPTSNFTSTSAPGEGVVSFGADANKAAAETSVSTAVKPSGFSFGNTSALATGFADASKVVQDQTQLVKPASGFSFGGAPAANAADLNQAPSAAPSLFSFGSSTSTAAQNPLLNPTATLQGSDSSATAATASPFSFGNKPAAAIPTTPTTIGAASSAGMFSFGGNPSTTSTSTAATFSFGPGAPGAKSSFGSSSTSASFTFTPKAANEKTDNANASSDTTSKPAASSFMFGGGAATTAESTNPANAKSAAASQAASPFTFGSVGALQQQPTNSAAAPKPPADNSLFSFGSAAANAPSAPTFGSTPATIASTNTSAIFGASATSAAAVSSPLPPSFGSAVSTNPPAFGAPVVSTTTTNTFGSFSASAANPFTGATANASAPNANVAFGFGAPAGAKTSKSVTFGASTVMPGNSSNLFGQAAAQPPAASTASNLFVQMGATSTQAPASSSIFGQTSSGTTPLFGSATFGQTASAAAPVGQTNQSSVSAAASPFQFGATAAAGGGVSATTGSTGFSFGSSSAPGGAPVFGTTPAPTFGSSASTSNPPAFGSAASSNPPAFGATASSTGAPTFGAAPSSSTPSFGAATALPSFGAPASSASAMFQFSSGNPGTPQQPNAFNAAGGNSASAASRRPRARAHRRNR